MTNSLFEPGFAEEPDLVAASTPPARRDWVAAAQARSSPSGRRREEGAQLLVGVAQLARDRVPEAPVELHAELGGAGDGGVEARGIEAQQRHRPLGEGVPGPFAPREEARLAEEVARAQGGEREDAVRGRALDEDLSLLDLVEVGPGRAVGEDPAPLGVSFEVDPVGQLEDLLVGEVGPRLVMPDPGGELQPAITRQAGWRVGRSVRGESPLPEALPPPFEPLEGEPQCLLTLVEERDDPLVLPAERLAQGADPAPQALASLRAGLAAEEEGVDRGLQGGPELPPLVLDLAEQLGGHDVEGVQPGGPAEHLGRPVEVLPGEHQPPGELPWAGIAAVLRLRDLEALEGPERLPAFGIEVGEAEEVGGVDDVAPGLLARLFVRGASRSGRLVLLPPQLGQRELDTEVAGIEALGDAVELGRLGDAPLLDETPGERHERLGPGDRGQTEPCTTLLIPAGGQQG